MHGETPLSRSGGRYEGARTVIGKCWTGGASSEPGDPRLHRETDDVGSGKVEVGPPDPWSTPEVVSRG